MNNIIEKSEHLFRHGSEILNELGLKAIFSRYGKFALTGSFDMHLLVNPDIDFLIKIDEYNPKRFFEICAEIAIVAHPIRIKYIDQREAKFPPEALPMPSAYFLGINMNYKGTSWSLDGWCTLPEYFNERLSFHETLKDRIATAGVGDTILQLKTELYGRKGFTSMELYNAVLDGKVATVNEFERWYLSKFKKELGQKE